MEIIVKTLQGRQLPVRVEPNDKVVVIAEAIENWIGYPKDMIRLLFAGKELDMNTEISNYFISNGSTIHVLLKFRSSAAAPAPAPAATSTAAPAATNPNADVEKCWSMAYQEEWLKAKDFLETGKVTLDQLEQRCKMPLLNFFAMRSNMIDALKYVVEKRGKPPCLAVLHATNEAARAGRLNELTYLLGLYSIAEFEAMDGESQPLHWAARKQWLPVIKFLIEKGANPNYVSLKNTCASMPSGPVGTPLMSLVPSCTSTEILTYFLGLPNVDVNFRMESDGSTALHVACRTQFVAPETVIELLKYGADPTIKDAQGKTPRDLVHPPTKVDDKMYDLKRVFNMLDKGKIRPLKRKAPDDGAAAEDEPPAKRVKIDPTTDPTFHTLDARTAHLDEWTRELDAVEEDDDTGKERNDEGKSPLRDAIELDLQAIADDANNGPFVAAAKWSIKLAETLKGIPLLSESECDWIPFIVEVPVTKKKSSVMIAIRQAIRAPKAKLKSKNHTAKAIPYFGAEISEVSDAKKAKIEAAAKMLKSETSGACEVRFPEEAVSYPVFHAGYMEINDDFNAIVGVFAVRVDT